MTIEVLDLFSLDTSSMPSEEPNPVYSDHPITFHIGLHKSGSSWLLSHIVKPHHGSKVLVSNAHEATHRAFLLPKFGSFSIQKAHGFLARTIDESRTTGLPLLVRDEALAGSPFGQKHIREVAAFRIKKAFPKAKIIITIREQTGLILSLYGHYIKSGYSSKLENFVAQADDGLMADLLDRDAYDYARLYQFYTSVFGSKNVLILPMESSTMDINTTSRVVGDFLGTELPIISPERQGSKVNQAWSWRALMWARQLNKCIPHDSRNLYQPKGIWRKLAPMSIAYQINKLDQRLGTAVKPGQKRDQVQRAIGSYYAASNARFEAETGIPLSLLGYLVE